MDVVQATEFTALTSNPIIRFVFALLIVTHTSVADASNELPDLGLAASSALTLENEQQIGDEMIRQLRRSNALFDDFAVNDYIQHLGQRLAAASGSSGQRFNFLVIHDKTINAFAMPGGHIGVHTGLINASQSESELAAVIAHEIAHVTQRHIARRVEALSNQQLPMTGAILAAILLSSQNPQIGHAAISSTIAGSTQLQLDYSREYEHEADRVGIQTLANAGFNPAGMADFFERLQSEHRYQGNIPEFLRTHPVTESRIADARHRASQLQSRQYPPYSRYALIRARTLVLTTYDTESLLTAYRANTDAASRYALALLESRNGDPAQAAKRLRDLLEHEPGGILYMDALAQTYGEQGRIDDAVELYEKGLNLYPGNDLLSMSLIELLVRKGQYQSAHKRIIPYMAGHTDAPSMAYELLARIEGRLGNEADAYLAQAEYFKRNGEIHAAFEQLSTALKLPGLNFYHASRIEAAFAQLREKHGTRGEDLSPAQLTYP